MPLRPEDVVRKTFRSHYVKRGYDEVEVDDFLDEVVTELRRLQSTIDELEAERVRPRGMHDLPEGQESERVIREREQLELVRTERRELVAEMVELQARLDRTRADLDVAERRLAELEQVADGHGAAQRGVRD